MKLDTFTKYEWVADLYMPVQQQDSSFLYEFWEKVTLNMSSGLAQTYAYSKEPIPWAGQLLNITNSGGQRPFFVGGTNIEMFVTSSQPVFDIYGNHTGYSQVLMRIQPNKWEDAAVDPALKPVPPTDVLNG